MEEIMSNSSANKVLIMEVEGVTYGTYRCYSKDVAILNMAISIGITPEINMNDNDVLPCDNSGYYLAWTGESKDGEAILMENIKLYFDEIYSVKDTGWDFSYLGDNDTYIQYMIDHKDELGISEFFD
jgi:hypothetical protein